ncbi:MAG: hypothetical protein P8Q36_19075, partial [Alphaproteobacteria bacterium]|nr:hypothetical protein [Alphaproteobacteria bacterium]
MGQRIEELSFLYGTNANYIEELYARYKMDPEMVDEAWRAAVRMIVSMAAIVPSAPSSEKRL